MLLTGTEVSRFNEIAQIYACDSLFYIGEPPELYEAFTEGQHYIVQTNGSNHRTPAVDGWIAFLSCLTTLSPGMGFSVAVYDSGSGSIYASGSWSMPDMAFPLNRSEIVCQISEGFCSDKILNVSGPSLAPSSTSTESYTLSASEDIYEIKSWENGILDAVSITDCRRVRLTINTVTKQVTQIAEDLDPLGCEIPIFGGRLGPIVGARVATLIDTWDAQLAYRKTIQDRINQVAGPLQQTMSDMLPAE